ncbi:MAG TPA: family 10 glycosylhydrolase [Pyrinomonadaceae bacterium]|jgi:uncharacterized lipoprotein YddW (UPF0748 family)
MKLKRLFIFFLFALFAGALPVAAREVRAVWVRPFVGADEQTRKNPEAGRRFIRAELARISRARFNTVYLETFWNGYAIYPTAVAAQRPLTLNSGVADEAGKGWDVLQTYLQEAKGANLEIHAWIHVFHQWNSNLGGLEKSPIFARHPEWALLDETGSPLVKTEAEGANRDIYKTFLSPSNKAAREFLKRLVTEITGKYPRLAGVQWDYARYPLHDAAQSFDYSADALGRFRKETGIDARAISPTADPAARQRWREWKTRQVTETVAALTTIVRRKRPGWKISAAVYPDLDENLRARQQDWKTWAARGYVDALLPMLYSAEPDRVETWAREFRARISGKTEIYPALLIDHFYDARGRKLNERYLKLSRAFDGFGLFAAQSLTDDLIEKLAAEN